MRGKRVAVSRWAGQYSAAGKHTDRRVKKENSGTIRLVICSTIFVMIVMLKLLFPGTMSGVIRQTSGLLGWDADFRSAFAAVGRAVSGEDSVEESLQEAYAAVFGALEIRPTIAGAVSWVGILSGPGAALADAVQRTSPEIEEKEPAPEMIESAENAEVQDKENDPAISEVYRMPAPPDNASLAQKNLGFSYTSPVRGTLTSPFGWREHPTEGGSRFHYGIDIAAESGTEIVAFADGEVYAVGESSTLGKYIILQHEGGYKTLYAHCSEVTVSQGSVRMGDIIARVGETGTVTGAHLHFELQNAAMYFNPIYYIEVW